MCASAGAREVSYRKLEANLSSTEDLVQQIDLSVKGYNIAADEKKNTIFPLFICTAHYCLRLPKVLKFVQAGEDTRHKGFHDFKSRGERSSLQGGFQSSSLIWALGCFPCSQSHVMLNSLFSLKPNCGGGNPNRGTKCVQLLIIKFSFCTVSFPSPENCESACKNLRTKKKKKEIRHLKMPPTWPIKLLVDIVNSH